MMAKRKTKDGKPEAIFLILRVLFICALLIGSYKVIAIQYGLEEPYTLVELTVNQISLCLVMAVIVWLGYTFAKKQQAIIDDLLEKEEEE